MQDYLVTWTIDVSAKTPREAAQLAYAIQQDPASRATVFTVCDATGELQGIDLEEPADET